MAILCCIPDGMLTTIVNVPKYLNVTNYNLTLSNNNGSFIDYYEKLYFVSHCNYHAFDLLFFQNGNQEYGKIYI